MGLFLITCTILRSLPRNHGSHHYGTFQSQIKLQIRVNDLIDNDNYVKFLAEPTNRCHPNPCLNQGTCSERQDGSYDCECVPGYCGLHCKGTLIFLEERNKTRSIQVKSKLEKWQINHGSLNCWYLFEAVYICFVKKSFRDISRSHFNKKYLDRMLLR